MTHAYHELTGMRFGRWRVIEFAGLNKHRLAEWFCKCECGTERVVTGKLLRSGQSKSCGCIQKNGIFGPDYTGKKFGRWTVIKRSEKRSSKHAIWLCRCDCGTERDVGTPGLASGRSTSCGCYGKEARAKGTKEACTTHGGSGSVEYKLWCSMIRRCKKTKTNRTSVYTRKNIKVCQRWIDSFENFLADMGPRPSPHHSLDRFPDGKGDYEPGNVRWATREEQDNNRGQLFLVDGEMKNVKTLSRETGIPYHTLRQRLVESGWPLERALTEPVAARGTKTHALRNTPEGLQKRREKLLTELSEVDQAIKSLDELSNPGQP